MKQAIRLNELAVWLKKRDDFVVIGHVQPDGDALGSTIACVMALRSMGKRAIGLISGAIPERYSSFEGTDCIFPLGEELPFTPKTAFSVDVSTIDRLGVYRNVFEDCPERAVLDHHETNEGFGDVNFIDGKAAASGELMVDLIEAMGVAFTAEMATWLYIAISTDCGRFAFSSTRAQTFLAASKLMQTGFDIAGTARTVFSEKKRSRVTLCAEALTNMQFAMDGKIAWTCVTREMLERNGACEDDMDDVIQSMIGIQGVEFATVAKERSGATKFSLRSKEYLDVAKEIALPFGGGGHSRAAGCTIDAVPEEALKMLLALAEQKMKE